MLRSVVCVQRDEEHRSAFPASTPPSPVDCLILPLPGLLVALVVFYRHLGFAPSQSFSLPLVPIPIPLPSLPHLLPLIFLPSFFQTI